MIVVAQLGARMHYAVPAILARSGFLERFYTDIYTPRLPEPLRRLASLIGPSPLKRLLGRASDEIPADKTISFPIMGMEYRRRRHFAGSRGSTTAIDLWAGAEFCRRVIRQGLGKAKFVYTYNSAGLELMEHARSRGLFPITEQTFAPEAIYQEILRREEEIQQGWGISPARNPLTPAYEEREKMEWSAAALILCGSDFVRDGIRKMGGPVERCRVVPYGVRPAPPTAPRDSPHDPVRVLTVGTVGLRKGAPYVAEAARILDRRATFRWAGPLDLSPHARKLLAERVTLLGAVPRSDIHRQFAWADVFLLPTLCEGSATVCYEAHSRGLPVITTPNAGSVIRDGVDGFIVPIRDAAAIADQVERLASQRDLWAEMSANAQARAAEYSFERYGERLVGALMDAGLTAN